MLTLKLLGLKLRVWLLRGSCLGFDHKIWNSGFLVFKSFFFFAPKLRYHFRARIIILAFECLVVFWDFGLPHVQGLLYRGCCSILGRTSSWLRPNCHLKLRKCRLLNFVPLLSLVVLPKFTSLGFLLCNHYRSQHSGLIYTLTNVLTHIYHFHPWHIIYFRPV